MEGLRSRHRKLSELLKRVEAEYSPRQEKRDHIKRRLTVYLNTFVWLAAAALVLKYTNLIQQLQHDSRINRFACTVGLGLFGTTWLIMVKLAYFSNRSQEFSESHPNLLLAAAVLGIASYFSYLLSSPPSESD